MHSEGFLFGGNLGVYPLTRGVDDDDDDKGTEVMQRRDLDT